MTRVRALIFPLFVVPILWNCGRAQRTKDCSMFYKVYNANKDSTPLHLINVLSHVISKDTACLEAYLTLGDLYFTVDNLGYAKKNYYKALLIDSTNIYSMYQLGMLLNTQRKYDSAIIFFQKAINFKSNGNYVYDRLDEKIDPKARYDVEANELFFSLGLALYYERKLDSALNIFNYTIQHKHQLDRSYLYRAAILIELKNGHGDPCSDLKEAKKYGSKEADFYLSKYCK